MAVARKEIASYIAESHIQLGEPSGTLIAHRCQLAGSIAREGDGLFPSRCAAKPCRRLPPRSCRGAAMPSSRKSPRLRGPEVVGTLDHDPTALAGIIYQRCGNEPQQVWVDDTLTVSTQHAEEPLDVPAHWLVGTYSLGCGLTSIADDLRALLRERAKDWVID